MHALFLYMHQINLWYFKFVINLQRYINQASERVSWTCLLSGLLEVTRTC